MRVKLKTWRHTEESRVAACILQSQAENWKLSMQTITVANEYHTDIDPVFREDVRNEKKKFSIEKGLFRYLAAIVKIALWWTLKHHFQRGTNSNSIKLSISLILNGNLHTNLDVRARQCPMSDVAMEVECIHFQFLPWLCARCVHFLCYFCFQCIVSPCISKMQNEDTIKQQVSMAFLTVFFLSLFTFISFFSRAA